MRTSRLSKTRKILAATDRQMKRAVNAGAETAVEVMITLAPELTGALKRTIKAVPEEDGSVRVQAGSLDEAPNPGDKYVDYELDVEFGTHKMAAQPFFRPGLDAGKRRMKSEMKITGE